jgi:hypothetical protein
MWITTRRRTKAGSAPSSWLQIGGWSIVVFAHDFLPVNVAINGREGDSSGFNIDLAAGKEGDGDLRRWDVGSSRREDMLVYLMAQLPGDLEQMVSGISAGS